MNLVDYYRVDRARPLTRGVGRFRVIPDHVHTNS